MFSYIFFGECLRRGDFRYTTILLLTFSYINFVRASGEAILGTLKYLSKAFFTVKIVRASGEAILDTLKYFSSQFTVTVFCCAFGEAISGSQRCTAKSKDHRCHLA